MVLKIAGNCTWPHALSPTFPYVTATGSSITRLKFFFITYLFSGGFYNFTVASLIVFIIAEGEFFVNKQRQGFSLPLFPLSRRSEHIFDKNPIPPCRIVDENVRNRANDFFILNDGRARQVCGQ
jgi:hypothetical protein